MTIGRRTTVCRRIRFNGIVQTGDGYLWLATVDGLARFDGVRFTVFNKSNSPGIVNNRFTSLFEDAHGDLWAGTEETASFVITTGVSAITA